MPGRALLSVSDKNGLADFARGLSALGYELVSTGGTAKALRAAGLEVLDVSEVTGFPEMMDGRVKTLHPKIHGGILSMRSNPEHARAMADHGITPIDVVVVNLYPFEATVAKSGVSFEEGIENIDIGGPSLVRASAKNHADVTIVVDPADYASVLDEMRRNGGTTAPETRRRLAAKAYRHTAAYDAAISGWFGSILGETFPETLPVGLKGARRLRYGENPHQAAAFYPFGDPGTIGGAEVLGGKELSHNNLLDLSAALDAVREFSAPACVVVKHTNPCGAAEAPTLSEAFERAYAGDPLSAYGGIVAFNRPLDEATARLIAVPAKFLECLVAPAIPPAVQQILQTGATWGKSLRILVVGPLDARRRRLSMRSISGGMLVQTEDDRLLDEAALKVVSKRAPSEAEWRDLKFAWAVAKHAKSNAIVLSRESRIVGVGAGQMSRVDSTHMAIRKAGERSKGSVLASDAFFPFPDSVELAAAAGVTALIHPGGSKRDAESVAAADRAGMAMAVTGMRHFRH